MPELCSEEVNHFYHLIRACLHVPKKLPEKDFNYYCLLYTSDAADEL